ncbi:unnamed protein product [Ambrosiozyma monospora]|uniref:Unnamed protein product n=1 Tax=Ambrosiozyma monospora TaxID=43982 RepID=A0A9W6YYJ9_AMBMO|nr:unnamed protein product [Ambrosiozyma monospora]
MLKLTSRIKTTAATKKTTTITRITHTLGSSTGYYFIRCYSQDMALSRIHPDIAELKLQLDDYDRYKSLIDNVSLSSSSLSSSSLNEVEDGKKLLNETVNDFQFTGLNLLDVLNKSVGSSRLNRQISVPDELKPKPTPTPNSISNASHPKDIDSLVHEGNFHSDLQEFIKLVQLCLQTNDSGSSLLKVLTKASQYTSTLPYQLSSLEISLMIQKLVKHHDQLMNAFMDELQFASRSVKDTQFSIKRRQIRDVYDNINRIFSDIENANIKSDTDSNGNDGTNLKLKLSILDYEWMLQMHMKQLHHKKAMELIERVEKMALEREDDSLKLTNKMWFHKIAIWTNSSELSFTVGKYNWKVHNTKDWSRFSSNKERITPGGTKEENGNEEDGGAVSGLGRDDADFGFKPTLDTLTVLKKYGESGYSVPVEGQIHGELNLIQGNELKVSNLTKLIAISLILPI